MNENIFLSGIIISVVVWVLAIAITVYQNKRKSYALGLTLLEYHLYVEYKRNVCEKHNMYWHEVDDIKLLKVFHADILDNI